MTKYTKTYNIWVNLKQKCYNSKYSAAHKYKNISICETWLHDFKQFKEDLGECPSGNHVLLRKDNTKNFSIENCYWGTQKELANQNSRNVLLTLDKLTKTATEWSEILAIPSKIIRTRKLKLGWSDERTLTTPIRKLVDETGNYLPKSLKLTNPHKTNTFCTDKRYYVYHIIDPVNNIIRYVGKGTGTRCYEHLKHTKKLAHNTRLYGWIQNLLAIDNPPIIVKVSEKLDELSAYNLEELEIKLHGRIGYEPNGTLFNIAIDGTPPTNIGSNHGMYGKKLSPERRKQISDSSKKYHETNANPFAGKQHTLETRKKMVAAKDNYHKNNPTAHKGENHPMSTLTNEEVREIKIKLAKNMKRSLLAEAYNTTYAVISKINRGERWQHITIN